MESTKNLRSGRNTIANFVGVSIQYIGIVTYDEYETYYDYIQKISL